MIKRNTTFIVFATACLFSLLTNCSKKNVEVNIPGEWVSQYTLDKTIVEVNTVNTATGFETIFRTMIADSADRAKFCQAFIKPVRFLDDNSGCFNVTSFNAWMVANVLDTNMIGTYCMDIRDKNGKYYMREMVNTAIYAGYGFIEYFTENPGDSVTVRKFGYVKSIPSAEFFISSSFKGDPMTTYYVPKDARIKVAESATICMAQGMGGVFAGYYNDTSDRVTFCRKVIDHVRFFDDQSGYFFMYDFNCVNVAHGTQKNLQGKDLYNYQDSRGNYVIRGLLAIAQSPSGQGYYEYWWNNPVTGKEEPKLAFVIKIPGINYFIGSGIYTQ